MMTVPVERSAVADAEAMVVVAQIIDWMALRARKLSDFIQGHACLNRPLKSLFRVYYCSGVHDKEKACLSPRSDVQEPHKRGF
jgi:hypothetical protein